MFEGFQHYLSYGSTDQTTVSALSDYFDGLIVPGTIAAFQAEGTRGFVLSLSARSKDPYVIDSRFPLFQNWLPKPKKSHSMLADVLGVPTLTGRSTAISPSDFTSEMVNTIAQRWIDFNIGFEDIKTKTFNKYASRLNEPVFPENRQDPAYVLPPYTMVRDFDDGWLTISENLWEASLKYATTKGIESKLKRVIAADSPKVWGRLAGSVDDDEIVAWVSGLEELRMSSERDLVEYGIALQDAKARGQRVFALYGGFLSVLLSRHGLTGSSHGIGFGEHRDWVELPSSGAPPARYYVPKLHRYIGIDIAEAIWRQFPELITCDCTECFGQSPMTLDYHQLMRHSVLARHSEIRSWISMSTDSVVSTLLSDFESFKSAAANLDAPTKVVRRADETYIHLAMWARVMKRLTN